MYYYPQTKVLQRVNLKTLNNDEEDIIILTSRLLEVTQPGLEDKVSSTAGRREGGWAAVVAGQRQR